MKQSIISLAVLMAAVLVGSRGLAAEGKDNIPILRLNAGGPISSVHSLAFTPGGNVLYAAGRDKLVHAWKLVRGRDGSERFVYERDSAWRVPIGPDFQGAINAIAVSADGRWLAAAGRGRLHDPAWRVFATMGSCGPGRH